MPKLIPESIEAQIAHMQQMAREGSNASAILCYLAQEQGIEEQLSLMERFRDAFYCGLGHVTAIGAWWHDGSCELDNKAIDAYIGYVVTDYIEGKANN